jgi:hypothetical protein
MIERYATVTAWAEWFERAEGVRIGGGTIMERLEKKGGVKGVTARDCMGRILRDAYVSEARVRQACADLLCSLPQAGSDGLVDIGGVRYGTMYALSHLMKISPKIVKDRVGSAGLRPIPGKDPRNRPADLYPEPAVLEACKDLIYKKQSNSQSR